MQRNFLLLALFAVAATTLAGCPVTSNTVLPPASKSTVFVTLMGLNEVQELDADTGQTRATIPVGNAPQGIAYDQRTAKLWVANSGSGNVMAIDPVSHNVIATVGVGSDPTGLLVTGGEKLWVANAGSHTLSVIDTNSGNVIATVSLGGSPFALSAAGGYIMAAETNDQVQLVDPQAHAVASTITTQAGVQGVLDVFNMQEYVGIETNDGLIHEYFPPESGGLPWTSGPTITLPAGAGPASVDYNDSSWLVSGQSQGKLQIVHPDTRAVTTVAVGSAPQYSDSSMLNFHIYVPNQGSNSISVVTPDGKPVATWQLAANALPYMVAAYDPDKYHDTPTPSPSPTPTTTPTVSPTNTPTVTPSPSPTPTATPTNGPSASGHIFVANGTGGNLLEFNSPFSASSTPVSMTIGGTVYGVAANSNYVAVEDATGFILMFAQPFDPNASPVAQFQAGSQGGQLAFDSTGDLFSTTQSNTALEYAPPFTNGMTPTSVITGPSTNSNTLATQWFSIALDSANNLYLGDLNGPISEYTPPYTGSPAAQAADGNRVPGPLGMAYYQRSIYATDNGGAAVELFDAPLDSTTYVFGIPVNDPHGVTLDNVGNLYVGDTADKAIKVFAQPFSSSSTPTFSMTSGVVEPVEMSFSP